MNVKTTLESMKRLQDELRAAGLIFGRLGIEGTPGDGKLVIFGEDGEVDLEIMDDPRLAEVIAAHVPDPDAEEPVYGNDDPPSDIRPQAAQVVQQLRAYLALNPSTTTQAVMLAQTVAVVKTLCRVMLFIIRRLLLPPAPPSLPEVIVPKIDARPNEPVAEPSDEDIALIQQRQQQQQDEEDALRLVMTIRQAAKESSISDTALAAAVVHTAGQIEFSGGIQEARQAP